jgi:Putative adhesin
MNPNRRISALTAGLMLAAAALTGCDGRHMMSTTSTYTVTGPVTRIDATSLGGRITLVAGDGSAVKVTETVTYTRTEPQRSHDLSGGDLTLTNTGCPHGGGECGVDYEIHVPAGLDVHLDSGGGTVTVDGASDSIEVHSAGGTVTGTALSAGVVDVHSAGGDTRLQFTTAPQTVTVDSAGGDASLRLPAGPYALTATTGGGNLTNGIGTDPAASRHLDVTTSGGTLTLS